MLGPFAAGSAAAPNLFNCSTPGQIVGHAQDWYSIRGPSFPAGPQQITNFAVEPTRAERLYVTNGVAVMRSVDGGCSWQESFALPESGAPGLDMTAADSRILEIEISAPGVVYLPIQQRSAVGPRPRLMRSADSGASWTPADSGLLSEITGTIEDFDAPLTDPDRAYILVDIENMELGGNASYESSQALLETKDRGETWSSRSVFDGGATVSVLGSTISVNSGQPEFERLTADPVRSEEVWLYGEVPAVLSTPAAAITRPLTNIGALEISLDGRMIVAYDKISATGYLSQNGGADFEPFDTIVPVSTAAALGPVLVGVESAGRFLVHWAPPGVPVPGVYDLSPADGRRVFQIEAGWVDGPAFFGRTSDSIEVRRLVGSPGGDPLEEVETPPFSPVQTDSGVLEPAAKKLRLKPGESETIPYRLGLPPAPTPLDVYFLIDVSGSMGGTINGVRSAMQEIVERLTELNIDAAFGVGAFRAFNDPPAYARLRDIGPPDEDLRRALDGLRANGGGDETQMAALLESVTGAGEGGIEPGLNMHFRPGSLRVAILSTDEIISQGPPHPPIPTVIDALVDADVKQVGLAIQDPPLIGDPNYENPGEPASSLQTVARGSNATAPAGGVDCDGDEEPDIPEGGPIVCLIPPSRSSESDLMADAIVHILEAIQDIQDVGVSVSPSGDAPGDTELAVVDSISPQLFPTMNLKEAQNFEFDVTVACPEADKDLTSSLEVSVSTSKLRLGTASLTVLCDAPPKPKEEEEPEPIPVTAFVPLVGLPLPPPRPPDPVVEPNPNPQPNPQGNPGAVAQEQKQPQLAMAQQEGSMAPAAEETADEQFLMTAHSERSRIVTPGAVFLLSAVTMTLVYGFATMWRDQIRTQHARGDRPRRYP